MDDIQSLIEKVIKETDLFVGGTDQLLKDNTDFRKVLLFLLQELNFYKNSYEELLRCHGQD